MRFPVVDEAKQTAGQNETHISQGGFDLTGFVVKYLHLVILTFVDNHIKVIGLISCKRDSTIWNLPSSLIIVIAPVNMIHNLHKYNLKYKYYNKCKKTQTE